ncbi:hypothetical protein EYC84_007099 [Monilinia fructicola]|uniref:Zn(2)-C6 fungal-type domain-containing protein n=1 Tax=Monilinia fructicola TaxID=38448 RepID=A0A5M9K9L2_MONFR|nr:hypothetical protein EYC84_007099 [Monilinia fructicola]
MATSNKDTQAVAQHFGKIKNATQKKEIKFRARLPKVKTGCQNCKIRRIKCDETKPGCIRCFKFGIYCSGYSKQPDKIQSKSLEVFIGPRFTEELETRYFRYFCENAAGLAGPLRTGVWSEIIPQVCEIEPYIGHGLVALGAFIKHRKEISNGSASSSPHKHREFALREYGKSLRGMQEAINKNEGLSPRTALIACMLVFCIESIQGHQESASIHATNGIVMMYDLYKADGARCSFGRDNHIGPELQRAFTDLDLQVLYFFDLRSTAHHLMIKEQINRYNLSGVLLPFQNITDCYAHLQAIMRRNLHFINIVRKSLAGSEGQNQSRHFKPSHWKDAPNIRSNKSPSFLVENEVRNEVRFPPEMLHERDIYLADMANWEEASEDIFRQCMSSPHSESFCTAALLKAHAAASKITLHGSFYGDEVEYDQLEPYFSTIITYCALVHPYYSTSSYHTNLGILMPLFTVGLHCRDKVLRDRAIAMSFVSKEYREGVWDSYLGRFICQWIRDLEEPWRDADGHIPQDMRAKLIGLDVVVDKRTAQMFCTQRAGPGLGRVTKDIIVTW